MADEDEAIELRIVDDDLHDADLDEVVEDLFEYDERSPNLCAQFAAHQDGEAALEKIARMVVEDFDADWENSEEYRDRFARDWKLFAGELPPKEFPFENCANTHVPVFLENASRLIFRIEGELFGNWTQWHNVMPTGPDDEEAAEILTLHGNWQLRDQIEDFPRQMSRGITLHVIGGDVYCHSFWDHERERNVHEVLTCDDFVVPYAHVTTAVDLSDLPHYTKVMYRTEHEISVMSDRWHDVETLLSEDGPSWDTDPIALLRESIAETTGQKAPSERPGPYRILHYEGWLRLPQQPRDRWCQVIVDHDSKHVLLLKILEEEDWRDRIRFDQQMLELQDYFAQHRHYDGLSEQRTRIEDQMRLSAGLDPAKSELGMLASKIPVPTPPLPPQWMNEENPLPMPPKMVPVRMFSHTVLIENLLGSHGISFGRIWGDFNRAANTMLDQYVDAATLGNNWSLIAPRHIQFDREFSFAPGRINYVTGVADGSQMRNEIMEMRPSGANPQLMEAVEKIYEWGSSAVQAPNVLSGEPGKSGETFRGLASRIEQATKQLSVAARKYSQFVTQILKNNARLNAQFLEDEEIIRLTDWRARTLRTIRVGRHLYRRGYSVEIRSDLRFASDAQKVMEAQELIQLPQAVPPLQQNLSFIHAALRRYFEARKDYDLLPYLGPAPKPPETPLGIQPQQPQQPQGPQQNGPQTPPGGQ